MKRLGGLNLRRTGVVAGTVIGAVAVVLILLPLSFPLNSVRDPYYETGHPSAYAVFDTSMSYVYSGTPNSFHVTIGSSATGKGPAGPFYLESLIFNVFPPSAVVATTLQFRYGWIKSATSGIGAGSEFANLPIPAFSTLTGDTTGNLVTLWIASDSTFAVNQDPCGNPALWAFGPAASFFEEVGLVGTGTFPSGGTIEIVALGCVLSTQSSSVTLSASSP